MAGPSQQAVQHQGRGPGGGLWAPCRGRGIRRRLTLSGLVRKALVLLHTQGPGKPRLALCPLSPKGWAGDGSVGSARQGTGILATQHLLRANQARERSWAPGSHWT